MRPERLFLHVGMPKAASSALQVWADANRAALLAQGVDYPPPVGARLDPKHQILVTMMIRNQLELLPPIINAARAPTLFLSTEGLSFHFQDFRPVPLQRFREATRGLHLTVFMLTRATGAWLVSQYKQAVINPPVVNTGYACSLSLADFAKTDRIRRLLDGEGMRTEMRDAYGAAEIVTVDVADGWREGLARALGVTVGPGFVAPVEANVSVSDALTELVRQVNGLNLDPALRAAVLALFQEGEATRHNMMKSYRLGVAGKGVPRLAIAQNLARLVPADDAAAAIVERARRTLSALGERWP